MGFYWFALGVLAGWRLTHLLYGEDGPWNWFVRLRRQAGDGFWAGVLDCFNCLSLWIAFPLALVLARGWFERLLVWPALSAGAILLQRLIEHRSPTGRAQYFEDEEPADELLRETEGTALADDANSTPQ